MRARTVKAIRIGLLAFVCILAIMIYDDVKANGFEQYQFQDGTSVQSQQLPGRARQYQLSGGVTGQSIDLPGGTRQYNFSDGGSAQRLQRPRRLRDIRIGIRR